METVWDNQFETGREIANRFRVDEYKGLSQEDQTYLFEDLLAMDFNAASMREL